MRAPLVVAISVLNVCHLLPAVAATFVQPTAPVDSSTVQMSIAMAKQVIALRPTKPEVPSQTDPFSELHPLAYSINVSTVSTVLLEATRLLLTKPELFDDVQASSFDTVDEIMTLNRINTTHLFNEISQTPCLRRPTRCNSRSPYRSSSGWCNNVKVPERGSAFVSMLRLLPPVYDDKFNSQRTLSVTGSKLPSARAVSAKIHHVGAGAHKKCSHFVMQWGQFLDHDITLTPVTAGLDCSACDSATTKGPDCFPIPIPSDDPYFPPTTAGGQPRCLPFVRSLLGQRKFGFRQQTNQITSFIDSSNVYGSDACTARGLRSLSGGKLKAQSQSAGVLLPPNPGDSACASTAHTCFRAGDERVNEHVGLASFHTIWLREHNRLAEGLSSLNPHWTDEKLYQEARRIVGAFHQHISYNEDLPIVLGPAIMQRYQLVLQWGGYFTGYSDNCAATITNEFATAAYRFGHTLIQSRMQTPSNGQQSQFVQLRNTFFKPDPIFRPNFIDSFFRGMSAQPSAEFDGMLSEDVARHLFEVAGSAFSGMDLVALNVQRGRDHGLPPYSRYREIFGLPVPRNFADLREWMANETVTSLQNTYASVLDIDLFTGLMLERPETGAIVGPTTAHILGQQFRRLRKCDRFWYENGNQAGSFTLAQLAEIRKITLAKVVCRHSPQMTTVQPNIFLLPDAGSNAPVSCSSLADVSLAPWKDDQTTTTRPGGGGACPRDRQRRRAPRGGSHGGNGNQNQRPPPPPRGCKDEHSSCASFVSRSFCTQCRHFMWRNCRKSCNWCNVKGK